MASLAFTMQAQDITNTLSGNTGNFKINKSDGTSNLFTISETGDHIMQLGNQDKSFTIKNANGNPIFIVDDLANYPDFSMLRLGHADVNFLSGDFAHIQLQATGADGNVDANNLRFVGIEVLNNLEGYYSRGTINNRTAVQDDDAMLFIKAWGHDGTTNRLSSFIGFKVDGTPANNLVPGKIIFATGTASAAPAIRMTIKNNGRVNIATVLNLTPGSAPSTPEEGDIYYDSSTHKARCWNGTSWNDLW